MGFDKFVSLSMKLIRSVLIDMLNAYNYFSTIKVPKCNGINKRTS